jgi:hypothetical protein
MIIRQTEIIVPGVKPRFTYYGIFGYEIARTVRLYISFKRESMFSFRVKLFHCKLQLSKFTKNDKSKYELLLKIPPETNLKRHKRGSLEANLSILA